MDDLQRAHNDWLDPDSPRTCSVPEVSDEWLEDRRMDERMEMMAIPDNEDNKGFFPPIKIEELTELANCPEDLSLRDYFAAKAMNGFLSHDNLDIAKTTWEGLAEDSFALADAMLAESKKAKQ